MSPSFALIGDPVDASPSPAMHRAALRALGLPHDYVTVRVSADDLEKAWPAILRDFAGLNVTIPLKERVVPLLDGLEGDAARTRSVNTVELREGSAIGHSTDAEGFLRALDAAEAGAIERALILGAGGAARAVAAALAGRGAEVLVAGRTPGRSRALAEDLGATAVPWGAAGEAARRVDLLVNATPVGTGDPEASPLADAAIGPDTVVFDLVYRPRRTALLRWAEAAGCVTIEGVEMLVEQGALSLGIWTGREAPRAAMRDAAVEALDAVAGRSA